ncbi:MAG: winged helix-turn-helix domain-containing protein [Pyrinomonadaceae bacterium]
MTGPQDQIYRFDRFQVDEPNRQLLRNGEAVSLPKKAFDLLLVLLKNNGRAVTKNELLDKVWPDQFVEEVNLTVQVAALRKALCENKENARYILTIPKHGYRFVAEFQSEKESEPIVEPLTATRFFVQPAAAGNLAPVEDGGTMAGLRSEANVVREPESSVRRLSRGWMAGLLAAGGLLAVLLAIGFGSWRPGRSEEPASVLPFQQVTIEQLTSNSKAMLSALSPDGKLFVYASRNRGLESLLLASVEGGEPRELIPPADVTYRSLKFSPNGGTIYYNLDGAEDRDGTLFRILTFGGVPEKLRDNVGGRITFSPDMRQMAFARHNAGNKTSSLVIAEVAGTAEKELVSRPESLGFRSFSPSWSPDGKTIAAGAPVDASGRYEVFVASVADGHIRQLTSSAWNEVLKTEWMPDGSGLVIAVRENDVLDNIRLWQVSYPEGSASPLFSDLDSYNGATISLSSDGRTMLAIQDQRVSSIWVAPANDLRKIREITSGPFGRCEGCYGLAWMPDGRLVYGARAKDSTTIWMMDGDGGNPRQITSDGYVDIYLSVTDDGRYVVFQSDRSGSSEIWRTESDGGGLKQLTTGGHNERPEVSPDGKWVVYLSYREGLQTVWRVSIEGGEPQRLSDEPASWPRVSPDGRFIACGLRKKLAIIPIEGGPPVKLFDIPRLANFLYSIRWTADGKNITYRDWVNGIWSQPVEGGEPKRLAGLPEEKLGSYAWSSDGRKLVFIRGSEMREVVLIRAVNDN